MNNIKPYKLFEHASKSDLDAVADRIMTEGWGRPIRDLIESDKAYQVEKYGQRLCDPDVLFDRWHKLLKNNRVLANVSDPERMVMLLSSWGSKFNKDKEYYNPYNLSFTDWLDSPQTLYRGMPASHMTIDAIERGVFDRGKFASFSFLERVAEKFTIAGYSTGGFVRAGAANGYIFSAQVKPKDFHMFMGVGLDDEMEVIVKLPVKVKLRKAVGAVAKHGMLADVEK